MAAGYIPDPIVENILTRLPAKPLIRFRCVSKHWNSLITDPHFMSSRSRRMIFLATKCYHLIVDYDVALKEYRCEYLKSDKPTTILGTLNGLVLLRNSGMLKTQMILYNPFTRATNKISHSIYSPGRCADAYGFCYGATTDDLRIIALYDMSREFPNRHDTIFCEVFNFKTSSWRKCTLQYTNIKQIKLRDPVGTFLNGYLYWIIDGENKLIALNLKDMVLSELHLPFQRSYFLDQLGTVHGCLCLIRINHDYSLGLWVMNGQGVENSWSNTCSRKLCSDNNPCYMPICTLDNGKILMMNYFIHQLIIYDTSNDSYKVLNTMLSPPVDEQIIHGIEYVESLFSPSSVCFA